MTAAVIDQKPWEFCPRMVCICMYYEAQDSGLQRSYRGVTSGAFCAVESKGVVIKHQVVSEEM